jgi:hypothetical protein
MVLGQAVELGIDGFSLGQIAQSYAHTRGSVMCRLHSKRPGGSRESLMVLTHFRELPTFRPGRAIPREL